MEITRYYCDGCGDEVKSNRTHVTIQLKIIGKYVDGDAPMVCGKCFEKLVPHLDKLFPKIFSDQTRLHIGLQPMPVATWPLSSNDNEGRDGVKDYSSGSNCAIDTEARVNEYKDVDSPGWRQGTAAWEPAHTGRSGQGGEEHPMENC